MTYPIVKDEFETIERLKEGYSLARYGDGELKMAHGGSYRRQIGSDRLAGELRKVLTDPHPRCLVGIPTMNSKGPKFPNWQRHQDRFLRILSPSLQYYSAFVSRPDSSPWIATRDYAESVQSLWSGKRVVVLCERKGSMFRAVRPAARSAVHVECPKFGAYDVIDRLEHQILSHKPDIAVLSAGPTATCLADRLAAHGLHAVDLGSAGSFISRMLA